MPGSRRPALPGSSLLEGGNTVAVTCESGEDKIYLDWFEADYERSFASAADSLKFTHAAGFRYTIEGFGTEDVELFDVSDPCCGQAGGQRYYQRQRPLRDRGGARGSRGKPQAT